MFDWAELWEAVINLFAGLGGVAFVWRLVDLYRDRVRIALADFSFTAKGADDRAELVIELDNTGRQAVLLARQAVLHGVHLGWSSPTGGWVRPTVRTVLRLDGDRQLTAISSDEFRWHSSDDEMPELGYWLFWVRIRIRLSNRRRSLTIRLPHIGDDRTVGPIRYWVGYALFRFGGRFLGGRSQRKRARDAHPPDAA